MISRDADTFVALARAVALAHTEGAVDAASWSDLSASLVAGMITGCMEVQTYGKVHDALARLLEKTFEGPARPVKSAGDDADTEGPLEIYLEVVGEAWDKVALDCGPSGGIESFVRSTFDLKQAQFGDCAWFDAPVKTDFDTLLANARAAGLLIISMQGTVPETARAELRDLSTEPRGARIVLGWGERRAALDIVPRNHCRA